MVQSTRHMVLGERGPEGSSNRETETQAERVYRRLRQDVLTGALDPGAKLPFAFLGARYDASVGTLREVLTRLAEQGLVTASPKIGFRVVQVSLADLTDLTDARVEIETLAFRRAIEAGDLRWESAVVAAYHRLDRTPLQSAGDSQAAGGRWKAAHAEFHTALFAGCPNRRIRQMATELRDVAELYRNFYLPVEGDRERADAEHLQLLNAVLDRDPGLGTTTLATHIGRTASILAESAGRQVNRAERPGSAR